MIYTRDELKFLVANIEDYPKPGIKFKDLNPLYADGSALSLLIGEMSSLATDMPAYDYVLAPEARGFILGPILANLSLAAFVPARKPDKLPPPVRTVSYDLEYGQDLLAIPDGVLPTGSRVLIHDDVLATGGTAKALTKLVGLTSSLVVGYLFTADIVALGGMAQLEGAAPAYSLLSL